MVCCKLYSMIDCLLCDCYYVKLFLFTTSIGQWTEDGGDDSIGIDLKQKKQRRQRWCR